jgi:ABC-2 type transport system permease protein
MTPHARRSLRLMAWLTLSEARVAWNSFTRGGRDRQIMYAVTLGVMAVFAVGSLLSSFVISKFLWDIAERAATSRAIPSYIFGLIYLLMFVVGFGVALANLYLATDLPLLLSSPVPTVSVLAAKLLTGLAPTYALVLMLAVPAFVGHIIPTPYPNRTAFILMLLPSLAAAPLIPLAAATLVIALLVRVVHPRRVAEMMALMVAAMGFGIAFLGQASARAGPTRDIEYVLDLFQRYNRPLLPANWLGSVLVNAGLGRWLPMLGNLLLVGSVCGLAVWLTLRVAQRVHYDGWAQVQAGAGRPRAGLLSRWRNSSGGAQFQPSGLLRFVPSQAAAVFRKDIRGVPRDLTSLAQVLAPMALGAFWFVWLMANPLQVAPEWEDLFSLISAVVATGMGGMVFARLALTSISMEGRAFWLVRSAPVATHNLVLGKFLLSYLPYLAVSGGLLGLMLFVQGSTAGMLAHGLLIVTVVGAGVIATSLAFGAVRPNLTWDTPHRMLSPETGCLSFVFYSSYGLMCSLALVVPQVFVALGSPLGTAAQAVGIAAALGLTALVVATAGLVAQQALAPSRAL